MSKVFIEESTLTAIGDAIRGKEGTTELVPVTDMATRITAIQSGGGGDIPEEAFHITGSLSYRFAYKGWDWFIEQYGNKITTSNISECLYAFYNTQVKQIPFEINFSTSTSSRSLQYMFSGATNLRSIPKFNNCKLGDSNQIFYDCERITYFPDDMEDWFDWSYIDNLTSAYSGNRSSMFSMCYSLRKAPMGFIKHGNPCVYYNYSTYNSLFSYCKVLDELVDLPVLHREAKWTNNAFSYTFDYCHRLKNIIFATQEDGSPYTAKWSKQVINLANTCIGFVPELNEADVIHNYNPTITSDKKIYDDASYQALKDDPDSYTLDAAYSRYNHDSAVATINSLPDTSDYLATAGGTNTIKFYGNAGSKTDGGAIGNLTDDEKAVAAAKGWTVSM